MRASVGAAGVDGDAKRPVARLTLFGAHAATSSAKAL